jgi:hypothetical protein
LASILSSEAVIFASNNWRLQEELMKQFACMVKCFSSDHIFQKFMPLLFKKLLTAVCNIIIRVHLMGCQMVFLWLPQLLKISENWQKVFHVWEIRELDNLGFYQAKIGEFENQRKIREFKFRTPECPIIVVNKILLHPANCTRI